MEESAGSEVSTVSKRPQYKLLADFFDGTRQHKRHALIEFDGLPNKYFEPLNEAAKAKQQEFLQTLEK